MIDRIIEFSARNRFIVFLFVAAAVVGGWWSLQSIPLDAIPDLSDTQVIVYSRWDRSPDIMEDQVTYPIVSAMLGAPKVKDVRGFSDFGYSYVYIIFDEGTDIYWARSRTLEYLSKILPRLPARREDRTGAGRHRRRLGLPIRAGDTTGKHNLAELRSLQDWYLRYYLQAVPGVAEVAPLGGFVRQYQVNVDPNTLAGLQHPYWQSGGGGARRQQRRGRTPGGIHRPRVHGARPRLRAIHRGPGERGARRQPVRRAGHGA